MTSLPPDVDANSSLPEVRADDPLPPEVRAKRATKGDATVRFQSLDGRDRAMEVPRLVFTEPISTLLGAAP